MLITLASAGKFKPSCTKEVSRAWPVVFCGMLSTFWSFKLALPELSTDAAMSRCPAELTTLYWSFIMNAPLRV